MQVTASTFQELSKPLQEPSITSDSDSDWEDESTSQVCGLVFFAELNKYLSASDRNQLLAYGFLLSDLSNNNTQADSPNGKEKDTISLAYRKWQDEWKDYPEDDDSLELEEEKELKQANSLTEDEKKKLIEELITEKMEENKKNIPGTNVQRPMILLDRLNGSHKHGI